MIRGNWYRKPPTPRVNPAVRRKIAEIYLRDPIEAQRIADEMGLAPLYAYKVANAYGLLPLKDRTPWQRSELGAKVASGT